MRKPTIKSTGLLLSAAGMTLATLSTLPFAHALEYNGSTIVTDNGADPVEGNYSLQDHVIDSGNTHFISGNGAVLYSNGYNIDLHTNSMPAKTSHLYVGWQNAAHGGLVIEGGSTLTTYEATIGNQRLSQGWVTVTGSGSKWESYGNTILGYGTDGIGNVYASMGSINLLEYGEFLSHGNLYVGYEGNGTISIEEGSLLKFDGSGMMVGSNNFQGLGALTIRNGGRVVQENYGTITFAETSTFSVYLDLETPNSSEAFVTANGSITVYAGAKLSVWTKGVLFSEGDEFILCSANSLFWAELGAFDGAISVPSAVTPSDSEQTFTLSVDGNNLVLTADAYPIPEPSTYALLGGVGAVALALARRRRCRR